MKPHVFKRHQRRAYRYAQSKRAVALFMEQRLGKSPVAIRWAKARRRVLLVAPLSTLLGKLNWQGELRREGINAVMLSSIAKEKRLDAIRPARLRPAIVDAIIDDGFARPPHDTRTGFMFSRQWAPGWFAINYDALRSQPELLDAPWHTIILDESTRIRNPKAQITKLLLNRTSHITHRAILSGLPNPESPLDYFCQFKFLHGHFLKFENYWSFREKLFYTFMGWDWQPRPKVRDRIKQYVHEHAFVLTRKQAKVGSEKVRGMRSVEMNAAQKRAMREMKQKFAIGEVETKWATVLHTWMQRVAGGFHPVTLDLISEGKMRLAEEVVMEEFRREPIVMWFRFTEEIEQLYRWLKRRNRKLKLAFVHGGVHKTKRPIIQEMFHDGSINLILLQVKLGRYGWKLSRSSTSVYYSNTYEFEDRAQSEDRVIHLEKREPCLYLDLVTLGTPDEDVVDALSEKRITARQFNSRLHTATMSYMRSA